MAHWVSACCAMDDMGRKSPAKSNTEEMMFNFAAVSCHAGAQDVMITDSQDC